MVFSHQSKKTTIDTNVEPVHSYEYDALHTVVAGPGVKLKGI